MSAVEYLIYTLIFIVYPLGWLALKDDDLNLSDWGTVTLGVFFFIVGSFLTWFFSYFVLLSLRGVFFIGMMTFIAVHGFFAILYDNVSIGYYRTGKDKIQKNLEKHSRFHLAQAAVMAFLLVSVGFNFVVFDTVDNARYFDDYVTYVDVGVPMHTKVSGGVLRVVDADLAKKIMMKSNIFGADTDIYNVHIGKMNGRTYWIGAVGYRGDVAFKTSRNYYNGFIAVDFVDPEKKPLTIELPFYAGDDLAYGNNVYRIVHRYNMNYDPSGNNYFTMKDDGEMVLVVPYSVKDQPLLSTRKTGLLSFVDEVGGLLVVDRYGSVIRDYKFGDELPSWIVQAYPEKWLETMLNDWGRKMKRYHDFSLWTNTLSNTRSRYSMTIDEDVRVITHTDYKEDFQIVLMDSLYTNFLQGVVVANKSGIFFYDIGDYEFIDTRSALEHANASLDNLFGNVVHGYKPIMPILYPIFDNASTWDDYAYVVPIRYKDIRAAGVAIVDPTDRTGAKTTVLVPTADDYLYGDMDAIVDKAIDSFVSNKRRNTTSTTIEPQPFLIGSKESYVDDGFTVIVFNGVFGNNTITAVADRRVVKDDDSWLVLMFAGVGDTIFVTGSVIDRILYIETATN